MALDAGVQLYRNYGKAVVDWVRANTLYNGKPIEYVFATPERAFARLQEKLANRTKQTLPAHQRNESNKVYPLPWGSVSRTALAIDHDRFFLCGHGKLYRDIETNHYIGAAWPQAVKLTYQVDLWTRNLEDLQALANQLLLGMTDGWSTFITVEHPFPYGSLRVFTQLTENRDLSVLEHATDQRQLRWMMAFQLDGWMARPPTDVPIVETITIPVYELTEEGEQGELYETQVVTEDTVTVTPGP